MRTQKFVQVLALLLLASGCSILGICKTDADCHSLHPDSHCYAGENPKPGDSGVCTRKKPVPPGESVDEPGSGSVDELGGEPGDKVAAGLVISSFSPHEAPHSAELHIQGKGFSAVHSENSVTLNGVPAEVVSASSSELRIQVPKNMDCSGPVQVTIGDRTATSGDTFTYLPTVVVSTFAGSGVRGVDNGPGSEARFANPQGLTMDRAGNLYVADSGNHRIRIISSQGDVSTFAGSVQGNEDKNGTSARFSHPTDIAIHASSGNLYVTDSSNNSIREIKPSSEREVSTFVGEWDRSYDLAYLNDPSGIAIDALGNFYVADRSNHRILRITRSPLFFSTFAGSDKGVPPTIGARLPVQFNNPYGLTIDTEGNFYVVDRDNHCIRKIALGGVVSTFAGSCAPAYDGGFADSPSEPARFNAPHFAAIDKAGNLYVADTGNHCIRKITQAGDVSTFAGSCRQSGPDDGSGATVRFNRPTGMTIDRSGNLYVADTGNHRIRKIVLE